MRRTRSLAVAPILALALLVTAGAASAQPAASGEPIVVLDTTPRAEAPAPSATEKTQRLGSAFIVPYYRTRIDDPNQTTTLIAIRNEAGADNQVAIEIFDEFGNTYYQDVFVLGVKETYTANFRDLLEGAPGVFIGGPTTGFATVVGLNTLTVDYFQVDTANDFATGGAAFRPGDICDDFRLRFLDGGGFSGGTTVQYYLPNPLGSDVESDPPSITGVVYDEAGNVVNTFAIYVNRNASASDLGNLVAGGVPFGSIDWTFESPGGGIVLVNHDALGRFSVRVPGFCLDSP